MLRADRIIAQSCRISPLCFVLSYTPTGRKWASYGKHGNLRLNKPWGLHVLSLVVSQDEAYLAHKYDKDYDFCPHQ